MKSVLISIQPKWCELIASGKKTVDVRKTKPKIDVPFKCYIYCTKDGKNLIKDDVSTTIDFVAVNGGKVIGEFVCDNIITAECGNYCILPIKETQVDAFDLLDYADEKTVYGWHISELVIYDKTKELSEFTRFCDGVGGTIGCRGCKYYYSESNESIGFYEECACDNFVPLKRPPQSWCYVEERSRQ